MGHFAIIYEHKITDLHLSWPPCPARPLSRWCLKSVWWAIVNNSFYTLANNTHPIDNGCDQRTYNHCYLPWTREYPLYKVHHFCCGAFPQFLSLNPEFHLHKWVCLVRLEEPYKWVGSFIVGQCIVVCSYAVFWTLKSLAIFANDLHTIGNVLPVGYVNNHSWILHFQCSQNVKSCFRCGCCSEGYCWYPFYDWVDLVYKSRPFPSPFFSCIAPVWSLKWYKLKIGNPSKIGFISQIPFSPSLAS